MQTRTRGVTRRRFTVHGYDRMAEAGIPCDDNRRPRLPRHAQTGVPKARTVDLPSQRIEQRITPSGELYERVRLNRPAGTVEPNISGMHVRSDDGLGPAREG